MSNIMFAASPSEKLQTIANSVLQLSDFYIKNPQLHTPWDKSFCQIAYRNYYLPLNFTRCAKVIVRGQEVGFFKDLTHFIDWGSGPGTASLALAESALRAQIREQILFDHSDTVLKVFSDLHQKLVKPVTQNVLDLKRLSNKEKSCLVLSYSFTELTELPAGWNHFEALMILEPSTGDDGRRLMALRETLIANGFSIWAPCTHHLSCPLLTHSKHDWCHDRAVVDAPEWFEELEQLLPMRNRTVTTSYLLARKRPPPEVLKTKARLTGDSLEEKGKTRQLICRNENREFLSWMHKSISPQVIARGELIDLNFEFEVKANELRLTKPIKI
jgi:ribosomal protein RSM22 (predicted rRNA methylase)